MHIWIKFTEGSTLCFWNIGMGVLYQHKPNDSNENSDDPTQTWSYDSYENYDDPT